MFEKYVYGRVPATVPKVTWTVTATDHEMHRIHSGHRQRSHRDGGQFLVPSDHRQDSHDAGYAGDAKGPVPVLMMFGRAGFPAPHEPSAEEFERINKAWKAVLIQQDPSLKDVFEQHPAWEPVKATPFQFPQLTKDGDPPATWQLVGAGWGFALFDTASVQADDGAGHHARHHWAGEQGPTAQARRLGRAAGMGVGSKPGFGLSRNRSGCGRETCGDRRRVTFRQGRARRHGFRSALRHGSGRIVGQGRIDAATTQLRRGCREPDRRILLDGWELHEVRRLGGNVWQQDSPGDIPVDSNELIALCAPRLTFISYGIPARATPTGSISKEVSWPPSMQAACSGC